MLLGVLTELPEDAVLELDEELEMEERLEVLDMVE